VVSVAKAVIGNDVHEVYEELEKLDVPTGGAAVASKA
jgi:hypothetical protein